MKTAKNQTNLDLLAVARRVISLEASAVEGVIAHLDDSFIKAVEMIYASEGRIIVTGLGKSGAIGRKISATLASTGTNSYFLHAADGLHGDLGMVHKDDVAICISKSGNSDELSYLLPVFKRIGVPIIAIVNNSNSVLGRNSDIVLTIGVKEEACPHDLAPTTSTTASLALGDALAITLLEKRGFTAQDFAFLHPAGTLGRRLLLRVQDLMETGELVPRVLNTATMKDAVVEIASKRGICVVEDAEQRITGVITNGDLVRLIEHTEQFFDIPVTEIMNSEPKFVAPDTLAYTAYNMMEKFRIIVMPVADEKGRLHGVIHLHDIMRAGIV